ncbi:acyltransferase family protein [Tundrisphaera lichenicola]|uniref:acyltransferase family protein n=1 Tax=Tundrisphaera lichenicola TaxID=2029860 RepID=UPI003EBE3E77
MSDPADVIQAKASTTPTGRLASLDVFRGLTVAGMILVNNGNGPSYAPLRHAEWDGWTPTDLVFPFFLFIVGVSISFALSKLRDVSEGRGPVIRKIIRRSLVIFALGLFLNRFPFFKTSWHEIQDLENWKNIAATIRIPGVLQRIALCYLAASLIFLFTKTRGQVIAILGLLIGYWLLMTRVPVPAFGAGDLARGHDLASYLDRFLLPRHTYKVDYDPEGILSTLPAIATTLIGVLAGQWLRSGRDRYEIDAGLFVAGSACVFAGWAWGGAFPINKALWTGPFVLLTAGLGMIVLAICYWLIDLKGYRCWAYPFRVFGANAIAAYALAAMGARLLNLATIERVEGGPISVRAMYYNDYLITNLAPMNASLAYALSFVLGCFLVILILDALGIHIKA